MARTGEKEFAIHNIEGVSKYCFSNLPLFPKFFYLLFTLGFHMFLHRVSIKSTHVIFELQEEKQLKKTEI